MSSCVPNASFPSLTDRHRADPVKSGGVHYTPPLLAAFVAEQAAAALGSCSRIRVLDPACGDGALLAATAAALSATSKVDMYGFDIDATALHVAQARLTDLPTNCKAFLDKVDFIEAVLDEKESRDSLFENPDVIQFAGQFDLVIANPPYVRTQVLGADMSRRLAADFDLTGRVDLYQAFTVAMAVALRPGGVLALLCSNRFLTTKTGIALRSMLAKRFQIVGIYDLGDTKMFEAAVLPAVVIARRSDGGGCRFPMIAAYEDRSDSAPEKEATSVFEALAAWNDGVVAIGGSTYQLRSGEVDATDPRAPWIPRNSCDDWVTKVEAAAVMRFGDVGKFRVGVKTTADNVFIRDDWSRQKVVPESELLLPLFTHHVAQRWSGGTPQKQILYPYDRSELRRSPVDLAKWPATLAYLEGYREQLEGRKYVIEGGRRWWEIWVPQQPARWTAPKILCPDISEEPKFFYDTSGAVVNGDCYWLVVDDENLAFLMMAVANSSLGRDYYDAVCGNKLYAGRRRYITQYVERFPIPDPNQKAAKEIVKTVRELIIDPVFPQSHALEMLLDRLVRSSFGLE